MGWTVVARNAAQTTVANAKLKTCYGGCGYYRQPGAVVFFAPVFGKKKTTAGAIKKGGNNEEADFTFFRSWCAV